MTKKEVEKLLNEELKHNKELADIIKNDPKKRDVYIAKFLDEQYALEGNPVLRDLQCESCIFSKSEVIAENGPHKGWCLIYSKESGNPKPLGILKNTEKCLYRKVVDLNGR